MWWSRWVCFFEKLKYIDLYIDFKRIEEPISLGKV